MGKVYLSQFNFKNYMGADTINVQNNYQTPAYLEELSLDNSDNIYLSKKTGLRYDYLVTTEGEDQVYVNSNLVGFCRDLTELKETDFLNKDIVNYRLAYNMHTAFSNCYQLSGSPVSARNVRSMYGTYYNCQALTGRAAVNANVNNLIGTYYNCNSITTVPHTTENARMMIDTFYNCTNLEGSPTDADLAVSMQNAYYNCYLLEGNPANCNSAIITVNAYYNCPNIYGNFYWCNRDFDQAEKIRAVNMFYNRDTSKRLNIFIRRDSAVENALLNYSDTLGNIYGVAGITWTPYPSPTAEYPNYYYNTAYNTNIIFLENVVLMQEYFNLARYSGLGYNIYINNDNSYENYRNHPELVFNNTHINIERHFLINVVKNVEDIPQGYVFDHYLNYGSGHTINVYKQEKDANVIYQVSQYSNNQYYNYRSKSKYIFSNTKTINYIISTEGYDFQECYLQNNYMMTEQFRLTNIPYTDVNNIFNMDKVKYMAYSYVGQFRNDYFGDDIIQAICPKKVTDMIGTYADGRPAIASYDRNRSSSFIGGSYYNGTYYYLNILENFYIFDENNNTFVIKTDYTNNGPNKCLFEHIFVNNIKFTTAYFNWYYRYQNQPRKKIKPYCGISVKNMIDTYLHTNIMNYRPACGDNVINFINAYYDCRGNNAIKPYIGPNVQNAMGAYYWVTGIAENKYYIPSNVINAHVLYYGSADNLWYNLNNIVLSNNLKNIDGTFIQSVLGYNSRVFNNIDENRPYREIIVYEDEYLIRPHLVNLNNTTLKNTLVSAAMAFAGQNNIIETANFISSDLNNFTTNYSGLYFLCNNFVSFNGPYSYGQGSMIGTCYGSTNLRYIENTPQNHTVSFYSTFAGCSNLINVVLNNVNALAGSFYSCKNLENIYIEEAMPTARYITYYINGSGVAEFNGFPMAMAISDCPNLYYFTINNINNRLRIIDMVSQVGNAIGNTNWRGNYSELYPHFYISESSGLSENCFCGVYNLVKMTIGQKFNMNSNLTMRIALNGYHSNLIEIAPSQYGHIFTNGCYLNCENLTSVYISLPGIGTRMGHKQQIRNCTNLEYLYLGQYHNNLSAGNAPLTLMEVPNLKKIEILSGYNAYITTGYSIDQLSDCHRLNYIYTIIGNNRNNCINNGGFNVFAGWLKGTTGTSNYCWNCDNLIDVMDIPYNLIVNGFGPDVQPSDKNFNVIHSTVFNSLPNFTSQNIQSLIYRFNMNYLYGNTGYYWNYENFPLEYDLTIFDNISNLNLYNLNRISFNFYLSRGTTALNLFNNGFYFTKNCIITNINPSLNEFFVFPTETFAANFTNNAYNYHFIPSICNLNLLPYNNINHISMFLEGYLSILDNSGDINIEQAFSLENIQSPYFINQPALRFIEFENFADAFRQKEKINEVHIDSYAWRYTPSGTFSLIECIDYNNFRTFAEEQYNACVYNNYSSVKFHFNYQTNAQNLIVNKNNIYKNYYANLCSVIQKNLILNIDAFYSGYSFIYGMTYTPIENCIDTGWEFGYLGRAILTPVTPEKQNNTLIFPYGTYNYTNQNYYLNSIVNYENFYGYNINNINIWFSKKVGSFRDISYPLYCDEQCIYNQDNIINENIAYSVQFVQENILYINGVKRITLSGNTNVNIYNFNETPRGFSITPEGSFMSAVKDPTLDQQRTALFGRDITFTLIKTQIAQTTKVVNYKEYPNRISTNAIYNNQYQSGINILLPVLNNEFPNNYCIIKETIYKMRAYNAARNLNVYWYDYYLNFDPYE